MFVPVLLIAVAHCVAPVLEAAPETRLSRKRFSLEWLGVLGFTVLGFLAMGYHPGLEDDGVYLSAVKARLNPVLYPHDEDFFRLQIQATVFDQAMALDRLLKAARPVSCWGASNAVFTCQTESSSVEFNCLSADREIRYKSSTQVLLQDFSAANLSLGVCL